MKMYVAAFTLYDNGHEHLEQSLVKARNLESANSKCEKQEYGYGEETSKSVFSYGDSDTGCSFKGITEITPAEFDTLHKFIGELF